MRKLLVFTAIACAASVQAQTVDTLASQELQEVIVAGVRAQKNAPFAVANIKKAELSSFAKTGRELPFLFAHTPGIFAWGENGLGTGTSAMRIRGAGGSRINITLDGVSLNSPEDQTVFWANMNSYGALMSSVQIQRGIGTSTNGDGAFGGSISLATATPNNQPSVELSGSFGTYKTYNTGVKFSTGLLGNYFLFDGAYNETATDGYLHGTAGRSGSYYGGLTFLGDNFQIRYKNIGNFEKTGQAWSGVVAGNNDASLMGNEIKTYKDLYERGLGRFNPLYEGLVFDYDKWTFPTDANGKYLTYRYKMDNGSYWAKTTDNFYQNHNILSAAWKPNDSWSHNIALHYTYGHGYYNEFRPNNKFSKFGLTATDVNGKTIKRSDFVRKKGLTQHTYGILYNVNYKNENWDMLGGINLQQFRGSHFGYLTYVANKGQVQDFTGLKYYDSDGNKKDYSFFAKATYHLDTTWNLFADVQYRFVNYKADGKNDKFYELATGGYTNQILNINESYNFVNPKAGISYHNNGHKAYLSMAYASREPERNNFTDNGKYPAPNAEHLFDVELGYQYAGDNWHAGTNLYYMGYKDQFVQTGEQSDIGENLTTNVKNSYRMGAELTAGWNATSWFSFEGNAALSINKIKDFDEFVENWDDKNAPLKVHYNNSTLAFSPSAILNGFMNFHYKGVQLVWHTNYVSRQYLDNSAHKDRSLPAFSQTDINLSYALNMGKKQKCLKEVLFGLNFNNIFNSHYAASGWVYSAVSDNSKYTNDNRYYQIGFMPMAGFTMMGNITLKF
ncbi:TonB-dependent receptor [Prevotella aurantiaca]|jgi:tonB-dependent receptor|uniref:TonB-dependent receptor n=1 Tax=Prevotella aurantiaca TaxID=596085 RepID=A0A930MX39_9BACT|nr:TonB-dependent receptor [Prevotella aurantiaca]MBF1384129.1 TonB-dependent receptor [Prevotella aurantiaca]MBF1385777.1 TonB-dependent receptor [Prevotella aurantiaca]